MLSAVHGKLEKPVFYKTVIYSVILSQAQNLFLDLTAFPIAPNCEGEEKIIMIPILYVTQLK